MSVRYRSAKSSSSGHGQENDPVEMLVGLNLAVKARSINQDIDRSFILGTLRALNGPPQLLVTQSSNHSTSKPATACHLIRPVIASPLPEHVPDEISPSVYQLIETFNQSMLKGDQTTARSALVVAQNVFAHPEVWSTLPQNLPIEKYQEIIDYDHHMRQMYLAQESDREAAAHARAAQILANANRPAPIVTEAEAHEHDEKQADEKSANEPAAPVHTPPLPQTPLMPAPTEIPELSPVTLLVFGVYFALCLGQLELSVAALEPSLLANWQAWLAKDRYVSMLQAEDEAARREATNNRARSDTNNEDGDIEEESHGRSSTTNHNQSSNQPTSYRIIQPLLVPTQIDWLIFDALGTCAYHQHDYEAALHSFWTALTLHRLTIEDGTPEGLDAANLACNIGVCLAAQGQCTAADSWFAAALVRMQEANLNDSHPRMHTVKQNLSSIEPHRMGIETSQMRSLMVGVTDAVKAKEQEAELARASKATKKGKGKGDVEARQIASPVAAAKKAPVTPSAFPPVKDLQLDVKLFQTPEEESKEATVAPVADPAVAPVWLRAWTVQPNEYEKLIVESMAQQAKPAKAKGKGKGKAKAKK